MINILKSIYGKLFAKLFTENNQVIPICLPDKEDLDSINFENSTGIITGWGQTNDPGNVSMNLLEVEIPLLSNQVCQDLAGNFFNPLTQTCAGGFNISKSACYGDSGNK